MAKRHYTVTYIDTHGEIKFQTIFARNYKEVERKVVAVGGKIREIYNDDDIIVKTRSWKRTLVGLILVMAIAAICIGLYWYKVAK